MTVPLSLQTTENSVTLIENLAWVVPELVIDVYLICYNQVNSLGLVHESPDLTDVDHANLGFGKRLSLQSPPQSHGLHPWSSGTSPRT
jgi:hypothetical protein